MNKIKNIFLGTLALASVALASCTRNEFVEPEFVPKTFNLYSYGDLLYTNWELNSTSAGEVHSIMDLSMGYLSHTWSFMKEGETGTDLATGNWVEAGDDIRFFTTANGSIPSSFDDEEEDDFDIIVAYEPYYDLTKSCINSDEVVTFLYTANSGRYKINIQNTYDEKISYEYTRYGDEQISGYITQEYATPMDDGNYEVNLDFEIIIYATLDGTAVVYSDSAFSTEMDLESSKTQLVSGTESTMSIPVKAGTKIYFLENTGSTPWSGSSVCTWGATYSYGPDIDAGLTESEYTMPVIESLVSGMTYADYGVVTKESKDYTPSKVSYQFNQVGATYKITMTQMRKAYGEIYYSDTLETDKSNTNSVGYLFTVVE